MAVDKPQVTAQIMVLLLVIKREVNKVILLEDKRAGFIPSLKL